MTDVDTAAIAELYESWERELAQVDHDPDPALIASLEAQTREMGVEMVDVLGAMTAAFNEALHPRGRDGKFIEVGGLIQLFNFKLKGKDGKEHDFSGQRGKVLGITPDKKSDKLPPDIRVGLGSDPNKPTTVVTVKPDQINAAPEKARLPGKEESYKAPDVKMPGGTNDVLKTPTPPKSENQKLNDAGAKWNSNLQQYELPDGSTMTIDNMGGNKYRYSTRPPGVSRWTTDQSSVQRFDNIDDALASVGGDGDTIPGQENLPDEPAGIQQFGEMSDDGPSAREWPPMPADQDDDEALEEMDRAVDEFVKDWAREHNGEEVDNMGGDEIGDAIFDAAIESGLDAEALDAMTTWDPHEYYDRWRLWTNDGTEVPGETPGDGDGGGGDTVTPDDLDRVPPPPDFTPPSNMSNDFVLYGGKPYMISPFNGGERYELQPYNHSGPSMWLDEMDDPDNVAVIDSTMEDFGTDFPYDQSGPGGDGGGRTWPPMPTSADDDEAIDAMDKAIDEFITDWAREHNGPEVEQMDSSEIEDALFDGAIESGLDAETLDSLTAWDPREYYDRWRNITNDGTEVPGEGSVPVSDRGDTGFVAPEDRTPDELAEDDELASSEVTDMANNLVDSGLFDDWYGREAELHEGKLWLAPEKFNADVEKGRYGDVPESQREALRLELMNQAGALDAANQSDDTAQRSAFLDKQRAKAVPFDEAKKNSIVMMNYNGEETPFKVDSKRNGKLYGHTLDVNGSSAEEYADDGLTADDVWDGGGGGGDAPDVVAARDVATAVSGRSDNELGDMYAESISRGDSPAEKEFRAGLMAEMNRRNAEGAGATDSASPKRGTVGTVDDPAGVDDAYEFNGQYIVSATDDGRAIRLVNDGTDMRLQVEDPNFEGGWRNEATVPIGDDVDKNIDGMNTRIDALLNSEAGPAPEPAPKAPAAPAAPKDKGTLTGKSRNTGGGGPKEFQIKHSDGSTSWAEEGSMAYDDAGGGSKSFADVGNEVAKGKSGTFTPQNYNKMKAGDADSYLAGLTPENRAAAMDFTKKDVPARAKKFDDAGLRATYDAATDENVKRDLKIELARRGLLTEADTKGGESATPGADAPTPPLSDAPSAPTPSAPKPAAPAKAKYDDKDLSDLVDAAKYGSGGNAGNSDTVSARAPRTKENIQAELTALEAERGKKWGDQFGNMGPGTANILKNLGNRISAVRDELKAADKNDESNLRNSLKDVKPRQNIKPQHDYVRAQWDQYFAEEESMYSATDPTIRALLESAIKKNPGASQVTIGPPSEAEVTFPMADARILAYTNPTMVYSPPPGLPPLV